jgi:hypothetical protein
MRYRAAIPFLSVLIGLLLANAFQAVRPVAVTTAAGVPGYMDMPFYYKPSSAGQPLVQSPTGEKPQSKLWFHDGSWWGNLFNNTSGNYHIYRLNLSTQGWEDTGTVVDIRPETKADVLWDGSHLYVASGGGSDPSGQGTRRALDAVLYRYSYNTSTKTYIKDFGPVTIRTGGAETIVLDKDSTGKLWVTYTQNSKVYVNYSRTSDADWTPAAALVLNVSGTNPSVSPDDISTLVAFDGKIGVLWSNQNDGTFYFAYHTDGTAIALGTSLVNWTGRIVYRQTNAADDHLNIKALHSDPSGNVYAMVKTSYNSLGSPQLLLIVGRKQSGSYNWNVYIESYRQDAQTRPLLMLDNENRDLYVFTSDEGGGNIFYKKTSMDNVQFASGQGTLFMSASGFALNNVTSTKQSVNAATGIVVMASHDNESKIDSSAADYYFHNYLTLNSVWPTATPTKTPSVPPPPTPTVTPSPTTTPGDSGQRVYVPVIRR